MHNVMRKLISDIRFEITLDILNLAFNPDNKPTSIDQLIIEKVIRGKVLMDANIVAGVSKEIILLPQYLENTKVATNAPSVYLGQYSLYRIPPEVRDHRNITKVVKVGYPGYVNGVMHSVDPFRQRGGARLGSLSRAVLESHTLSSRLNGPMADAPAGDLIQLIPAQHMHVDFVVDCLLEFDENFSNLNSSAVMALSDLTVCATKALIYTNVITYLDQGRIIHGGEHGVIRDIVTRYETSVEDYKELLKKFHGGNLMNTKSKHRILHMMA